MLKAAAVAAVLATATAVAVLVIIGPGSPPPGTGSAAAPHLLPPARSSAPVRVPPGGPEWITIGAIGVHAAVRGVVSTHEQGSWLIIPPMQTNADLRRVYWWSERAAPADPSRGTAYIYGHACTHYALCAFNRLREVVTGDLVRVTTDLGTLTYRVAAAPVRLAKTAAGIGDSSIYDYGVVNRLVLITCGYSPDGSSPWNWVVITRLVSAAPAPQVP